MYKKSFTISTTIFLILFLFDYVTTLFSIDESGVYYSFFGLKYVTTITPNELETIFSLTTKFFLFYGAFLLSGLLITLVRARHKRSR